MGTQHHHPVSEEVPRDFTEYLTSFGAAAKEAYYAEKEYLKLSVVERAARVGSGTAFAVLAIALFLIALLLAVFAGAKAWGDALGSEALGYLATSGVVAGVIILLFWAGKPFRRRLKVMLINTMHGDED